jgi:crotonobetainyl-CoA:carnitine CoA-transferase CaiB-like acyl-CoA transferase
MKGKSLSDGLLGGIRVLDLGEGVSAPYAARTLAGLGADVIKVESPEGDYARLVGPFPDDTPHPEKSALYLALNTGKRGVTLDLDSDSGRSRLLELAADAHIVIDNHDMGWLDERGLGYESLAEVRSDVIVTQITPFGDWGPYAGYEAGDLSMFHMGGNAHGMLGPVADPDSEPPIRAGGHQADQVAGVSAVTATLATLFRLRMTGQGCHLVVSSFEAMATQSIAGLANIAMGRESPTRQAAEVREASIGGQVAAIGGVLPCNDGYVAISPREDAQWARWLELMGNPDWSEDPKFNTRSARQQNSLELWELLAAWTRQRSRFDIARDGQQRRIPCFPVNTVSDLLNDPHLKERRFFVSIDHPVAGSFQYPGVAYRLSNTPLTLGSRPAPTLGQHNEEVLS